MLGPETAEFRWFGATVSEHVKSHTKHRPFDQGDSDNPSGRLLSHCISEGGSIRHGTLAGVMARLMSSLTALWRDIRSADLRQLTTAAPHTETWGAHQNGAPRRCTTAIRKDELSSRVPRAEEGRAWRKSLESVVDFENVKKRENQILHFPMIELCCKVVPINNCQRKNVRLNVKKAIVKEFSKSLYIYPIYNDFSAPIAMALCSKLLIWIVIHLWKV